MMGGTSFSTDLGGSSKYSNEISSIKPLKTEVEKGSIWTAIGYGLVDPNI